MVTASGTSSQDLAGAWDALADRLSASPFMRPAWFEAWFAAFRPSGAAVLAAYRDQQLVGVLPLFEDRGAVVSPTNYHTPHFYPIAEDDKVLQALIEAGLAAARRRLDLSFVDADEPVLRLITRHTAEGGWRTLVRPVERSPYVELDGTWEGFEATLPSRRRRDMRRRERRLEAEGSVGFERVEQSDRLADLLQEGWAVEASGWKGADGTAVATDEAARPFYRQVGEWAAAAGFLRLFFLRVDGRAIGFAFCMADARSLYVLKIGFDQDYSKFAPGVLLTRSMLAHAFDVGLETYEFLGATDPYKLVWTDRVHERMRIRAFPETALGVAEGLGLAWRRGRPLVMRLLRR